MKVSLTGVVDDHRGSEKPAHHLPGHVAEQGVTRPAKGFGVTGPQLLVERPVDWDPLLADTPASFSKNAESAASSK